MAVVAGGIAGTAAAYHLAKVGLDVALLERKRVGEGATGAAVGILAPPLRQPFHETARFLGAEAAAEIWRFALRSVDALGDLLEERGITAFHGQMEEPLSGGFLSRSILGTAKRLGVRPEFYSESPSSFRRIVLGIDEPTVIRAWGTSVDRGRAWLTDLAQRYRL